MVLIERITQYHKKHCYVVHYSTRSVYVWYGEGAWGHRECRNADIETWGTDVGAWEQIQWDWGDRHVVGHGDRVVNHGDTGVGHVDMRSAGEDTMTGTWDTRVVVCVHREWGMGRECGAWGHRK